MVSVRVGRRKCCSSSLSIVFCARARARGHLCASIRRKVDAEFASQLLSLCVRRLYKSATTTTTATHSSRQPCVVHKLAADFGLSRSVLASKSAVAARARIPSASLMTVCDESHGEARVPAPITWAARARVFFSLLTVFRRPQSNTKQHKTSVLCSDKSRCLLAE